MDDVTSTEQLSLDAADLAAPEQVGFSGRKTAEVVGGDEQNVVERQRFLQNTHGLSLTQSGIIRARPCPAQTGDRRAHTWL